MGCAERNNGSQGRFVVTVRHCLIDTEFPSNLHLICSKYLDHTNHSAAAKFVA
jgi:hypothetical protein